MKTHPHLLVRDTLANLFVEATTGEEAADRALIELGRFAKGERPGPALRALRTEDGSPLFAAEGLTERFAPLAVYVEDRARRFVAARGWIGQSHSEAEPLERARAAWDAGLFFEVHEILEPIWLEASGPERQWLQGVIMAGAALHHLSNGNRAGARGLLREAAARLEGTEATAAYRFQAFGRELMQLANEVDAGRVRLIDDIRTLPVLERCD